MITRRELLKSAIATATVRIAKEESEAMELRHVLPTLLTRRNSFPRSIAAAGSQSSSSVLTQDLRIRNRKAYRSLAEYDVPNK